MLSSDVFELLIAVYRKLSSQTFVAVFKLKMNEVIFTVVSYQATFHIQCMLAGGNPSLLIEKLQRERERKL